ncbi:hypothetical protein [Rhizobium sp. YS-1r]|uniref:hypothetical protein n=1 Tax=Rhizobium sp. YS-1r TaxID=1532558 RepID=UPI000AA02785|nr:hypothetical protein [Rhizobium sp. YS-1r]
MTIASCIVGIDVSKQWLDCFLHPTGRRSRFSNDAKGHDAFLAQLGGRQGFCGLEATGRYDRALCLRLHEAGQPFHQANPRKARQFAQASGFLARSQDRPGRCPHSARYGVTMDLPAQVRPEPERLELRDLMEHRDQLVEMRKRARIRLAQPHAGWLEESLHQVIEALDRQIEMIEARMDALMASSPALRRQKAILCPASDR